MLWAICGLSTQPTVPNFETADEIACAESIGAYFVAIGPVVPEIKDGCQDGGEVVLSVFLKPYIEAVAQKLSLIKIQMLKVVMESRYGSNDVAEL